MSASKANKRESNKSSSFLVKHEEPMLTYLLDEQETTTLESVFAELFTQVEQKLNLTDNE